jgi:hypothetical protein
MKTTTLLLLGALCLLTVAAPVATAGPLDPPNCIEIYHQYDLGVATVTIAGCHVTVEQHILS